MRFSPCLTIITTRGYTSWRSSQRSSSPRGQSLLLIILIRMRWMVVGGLRTRMQRRWRGRKGMRLLCVVVGRRIAGGISFSRSEKEMGREAFRGWRRLRYGIVRMVGALFRNQQSSRNQRQLLGISTSSAQALSRHQQFPRHQRFHESRS